MCNKLPVEIPHIMKILWVCFTFIRFLTADVEILYRKEVCEEAEFYAPYVRLLKSRQPHHQHSPILKLLKSGYIDVSRHTGILCINGPAIVYADITEDSKCTNDSSTRWIPTIGEPQIFSHDCFSFNRLPRDKYKKPGQLELRKDSRVFGNKVFGIYLIGKSPDYRLSNFVFFPQSEYGYKRNEAWCVHDGGSVAFLVNSSDSSTHCYSIEKYNMDGIVSVNYVGNTMFCYREDQDVEFDTPWHKDPSVPLTTDDIKWESCGSTSMPSNVPKEYEPDPLQLPDFRMIHPKFWSSQGSPAVVWKAKRKVGDTEDMPVFTKPNPPGSLFPGEVGWKDPSEMIHPHIPGTDEYKFIQPEEEATTLQPYQKFQAEIPEAECEEIPKPAETCDEKIKSECMFLTHVLTLEEIDWKSPKLKDGSWRLPIIDLVNNVYIKACPQVTKFLAPALSRIFQYFLSQAIDTDPALETKFKEPRKREWAEMIMDLERCHEKATMMNFFRKKDMAALKLKKKLEGKLNKLQKSIENRIAAAIAPLDDPTISVDGLSTPSLLSNNPNHIADLMEIEKVQNHLNEFMLKFPYKILIGNAPKPEYSAATRVFQYREAAEIDHELDWALDAYWKVISTVLGYCNIHYASRDSSTFMRLYDSFTQDFLEYIAKAWVKGENRQIYENLFGEFIYGSGVLWLDACHDGAYQWSQTIELRPLRPLPLHEGDVPPVRPGSATGNDPPSPTNFFVDNPNFVKLTEEDYELSQDSLESQEVDNSTVASPSISNGVRSVEPLRDAVNNLQLDPSHNDI